MPKIFSLACFLLCVSVLAAAQDQSERWSKWEAEADTLIDHQDFAGATSLYSKIIRECKFTEKSDYRYIYKRAVSYYSANNFDSALVDMNRFVPLFPESPQARILRALIYRGKGDSENQLNDLQKAIELRGPTTELVRWRGALLADKGDFKAAKKDLEEVKQYQDDAELETNLGFIYYNLGSLDSALVCFNKSIVLDVNYSPSYLYAGTFCLQEEKFDLALKYLNLGLRIDPTNRSALFYKGVSLVELKRADEGCRCLRKAFDAGEDDAADYLKEYCYDIFK
ncbi:MAG TPA: tetratricopeptide repeat protein [Cyclobacteriaceae bacterium]|jgi:tetratricopeptide (TPR) repeat protein|nr:tetratricopeptide repeat protein [Cyclobacteriaceae bacterium]